MKVVRSSRVSEKFPGTDEKTISTGLTSAEADRRAVALNMGAMEPYFSTRWCLRTTTYETKGRPMTGKDARRRVHELEAEVQSFKADNACLRRKLERLLRTRLESGYEWQRS